MAAIDKDFIVAIELGSSKISGIAGKKNADGSMQILAYASEPSDSCIQRGVVFNLDKTKQTIENVVKKLETRLDTKVVSIYTSVGGQSLRSDIQFVNKGFPVGTKLEEQMVDFMCDESREINLPDYEVLDNVPQQFKVDGSVVPVDPVGVIAKSVEGKYLNVIVRKSLRENIINCVSNANLRLIESENVAILQLGRHILNETERAGCALVDMGAETTTVAVYSGNVVRYAVVIPIGANAITKDIAYTTKDEKEAEDLKLKYGDAHPAFLDGNNGKQADNDDIIEITTKAGEKIQVKDIQEVIYARTKEIIDNVWFQIEKSGYQDKLLQGIILTGGGANLANITKAFERRLEAYKIKVRIAKTLVEPDFKVSSGVSININNCMNNTLLAILADGKEPCGGGALDGGDLFGPEQEEARRQEQLAKEKAAELLETNDKLTLIRDELNSMISKLKAANNKLTSDLKDKNLRKTAIEVYNSCQLPDNYQDVINTLSGDIRFAQRIKETDGLVKEFNKEKDCLEELVKESKKASSWLSSLKAKFDDFINDEK